MGYRSDFVLGVKKEVIDSLKEHNKEIPELLRSYSEKSEHYEDDAVYFQAEKIKMYISDKDVEEFYGWIDWIDSTFGENFYGYVELGKDDSALIKKGLPYQFNINVSTIIISPAG